MAATQPRRRATAGLDAAAAGGQATSRRLTAKPAAASWGGRARGAVSRPASGESADLPNADGVAAR